ncbi:MAG: hypothetical protein AAGC68_06075 [Verrucomicrobiota bacterium]
MAGASAAGAGLAGGDASAITEQITLGNNFLSGPGSVNTINTLNGDITGDGNTDLPGLSARFLSTGPTTRGDSSTQTRYRFRSAILDSSNGFFAQAGYNTRSYSYGSGFTTSRRSFTAFVQTGFSTSVYNSIVYTFPYGYYSFSRTPSAYPVEAIAPVPVTFTDADINGGTPTNGFLEVRAFNRALGVGGTAQENHGIELVRLIFDADSTAAPAGIFANMPAFDEYDPAAAKERAEVRAAAAAQAAARAALRSNIARKIKKETAKLKKAKKSGNANKAKKIKAKIKKLKKQLRSI